MYGCFLSCARPLSCAGKAINLFWCFVAFIYFFFHTHIQGLKAGRGEKAIPPLTAFASANGASVAQQQNTFWLGGKNIAAWKNNNTQNKASIAKQNAVSQALCMFQATITR